MSIKTIGVIGGSGLYEMKDLVGIEEVAVDTPFGKPSDAYITGTLGDVRMVFLPRHGRGHRINPSEINYRANIFGMKKLGVEWIISVSAVGSMKESIVPGDIVIVDQFIDRTSKRNSTFYSGGIVGHTQFADPVCPTLSTAVHAAGVATGVKVHKGGTYLCMEGPQFSTRAESRLYRSFGVDVIGMTNIPEAKLAREAEICYATMALATDYDCWYEGHEDVSIDSILEIIHRNVENSQRIIKEAVKLIVHPRDCVCASAAKYAVITDRARIDPKLKADLAPIIGKYIS